ncbi:MAG: DNA-directed RNA polymerase subunit gamma, partial [Cyanobacteria bacterium P01_F01_bin.42]
KGAGQYFANLDDAIVAYEQGLVDLHAYVWVRHNGPVEDTDGDTEPEVENLSDGTKVETFPSRRVRYDSEGAVLTQFVKTTPGRIIYNRTIQLSLAS